ncbi:fla cluster protein FlaD [Halorubrum aidingense JCM 13560]|uniref:Fla cluster protein FlaD n=1 Tax=Halorubrum aidingense JCM 13560 TaxID=1230454 RepID=M0PIQ6_9EURY|nr:FlaD/FlaE family flagellar protein [Halorubrum aidingense]EMA69818.1 fla cluster protein FlaD [Halorubrum aidingense JCM 13560]
MSRNPQRYDVRELRRIAAASRDGVDGAPRERSRGRPTRDRNRNRAERAARSAAFTELLQRQRGRRLSAPDDGTRLGPTEDRPYLRAIPASPEAEYEVGEWLGYLVDVGGHVRARDALAYYTELGWVGPDAADALTRRLEGFDAPRRDRPFTPADHRISLVSVVRIASCAIGAE